MLPRLHTQINENNASKILCVCGAYFKENDRVDTLATLTTPRLFNFTYHGVYRLIYLENYFDENLINLKSLSDQVVACADGSRVSKVSSVTQ